MTLVAEPSDRLRTQLWLRGLVAVAWADGHLDPEECELITLLTHEEILADNAPEAGLASVAPTELAAEFGGDPHAAQNFLRTAVMVAIADGVYSESEDTLIRQFSAALGQEIPAFDSLRQTLFVATEVAPPTSGSLVMPDHHAGVLDPLRDWLDGLDIHSSKIAHFLCRAIPSQCPFERDIVLFGRKIAHIPPMCKINPIYEQLVGLRFRALSYLADDCGEDISPYC